MILTAFPVGFFAGLFGIGGGLITVPFLFFIFETLNIDKSYIMHLAVGTSFSIIVPTSLSSVLTHKKNNYVDINIIKTYIIFVIIGVLAGTVFAALMQTKGLVLFFSVVVYFLGTYLLLSSNKIINSKMVLWNGPVGAFEFKPYDNATNAIANIIKINSKKLNINTLAGGGDTLSAIKNTNAEDGFDYISNAGGAFLEWLEGDESPGVKSLKENNFT